MSAGFAEKKHETGGFKWKHRLSHVQNSIENEDQRTKTAAGLGSWSEQKLTLIEIFQSRTGIETHNSFVLTNLILFNQFY